MEYRAFLHDREMSTFIDSRTDEALLKDETYMQIMEHTERVREKLCNTGLNEIQTELLEEYIATVFEGSEWACKIAYMVCLKDIARLVIEL